MKRGIEIFGAANLHRLKLETERSRGSLVFRDLCWRGRSGMPEENHARKAGECCFQQLESLPWKLVGLKRQAGNISGGSRQTLCEPKPHGVATRRRHHDRDALR